MKKILIALTGLFLFTAQQLYSQELVYEFEPDSAIYDLSSTFWSIVPSPEDLIIKGGLNNYYFFALLRKNSDVYDIFSRTGQIGSFTKKKDPFSNEYNFGTYVTQKFFDTDNGWEVLYQSAGKGFLLVDDDGSTILSDICQDPYNDTLRYASNFGFDGNSTYLCVEKSKGTNPSPSPYKLYRFRTNISPTKPQSLSKKAAGPNTMMFFGPSAGDYRISLLPSGGGKTSVQLFDMMGRQVFESQVDDITRPFSITIPAEQTSRTPFITRVRDKNGSVVKKEIPVR